VVDPRKSTISASAFTAADLVPILEQALPIRVGGFELTLGRDSSDPESPRDDKLAASEHAVVVEHDDQSLGAYIRAADANSGDLNVREWPLIPAHARSDLELVRLVLRIWRECVLRFISSTPDDDRFLFVSPEFFDPSFAFVASGLRDERALALLMDSEFERRFVCIDQGDPWG
jgi:hypothetical protein